MLFKRKKRIVIEQAIVIERQIKNGHDNQQEVKNLYQMKYGRHNTNTSKPTSYQVYYVVFMTKKGRRECYVTNKEYQQTRLNALGELTRNRDMFVSFKTTKLATKQDVIDLGW